MKVSEQFYSIQGEGIYTGVPSYFIRFFGCSLQCQGFGQKDPANPDTWVQPWKTIDITQINEISDLPEEIYEYGCDSVYSWSAKFKHLQKEITAEQVVEQMKTEMGDLFPKLLSGDIHLVFTGGEPFMSFNQQAMIEILDVLENRKKSKIEVTIETNGTQTITDALALKLKNPIYNINFSISPKLLYTSGEKNSKAIKPEIIQSYYDTFSEAQFNGKFVVANSQEATREFKRVIAELPNIWTRVWLMPEGPNKHRVKNNSKEIAEFALSMGYCFSDRLHANLWDNKIGV